MVVRIDEPEGVSVIRLWLAGGFVLLLAAVLLLRWSHLQVREFSRLTELAHENQIKLLPVEPLRGIIYDRHGEPLADNRPIYSLSVVSDFAGQVLGKIDVLKTHVDIPDGAIKKLQKARGSRIYQGEIVLREQLDEREIINFVNWQFLFPEVVLKADLVRYYPYENAAGHVLGYVGRINVRDQESLRESGRYKQYRGAKFIGKTGLELINERRLRGVLGFQEARVDAHGRILDSRIVKPPRRGEDIQLTLDWPLQQLAESLLAGERGAAVVMDVNSGALLALASSPRFDVNQFIFGISHKNWDALNTSDEKPLIHRAIYGQYAPGSTIKPFLAMAALHNGWRDENYTYFSRGFFQLTPRHIFHDWKKGGHGKVDISKSIIRSVNTFYYQLGHDIGIQSLHDGLQVFGFGRHTAIDLDNEKSGILPSPAWKRQTVGETWYPGDTIAASVGQGYLQVTPLQMARAMAMLANGGRLLQPYLWERPTTPGAADFDETHITLIRDAMAKVTQPGGTAPAVGRDAVYGIAGKTGTAQVSRLQRDASGARIKNKDLPKFLRDHAWFVGYAPSATPQVAVAVIIEHGGSGGRAAGPVVRQLLDAYLAPPDEEANDGG